MTGSWAGHFFVLYEGILWAAVWFVVLLRGFFGAARAWARGIFGILQAFLVYCRHFEDLQQVTYMR